MAKECNVIIHNGVIGLISQVTSMFSQFVLRILIIRYMGVEIVGINATLSSLLQTLSLTELGFQTAVVYFLYTPLRRGDYKRINDILEILKRVYMAIGIVFIFMQILCIPILPFVLKNVTITGEIIGYYFAMGIDVAVSYFISYKRVILYADQKEYISKTVDCLCMILFSILKGIVIIKLDSFMIYLLLQIFQTCITNSIISKYCKKTYLFLKTSSFNKVLFIDILNKVKNVFGSKIAGYIYGATDNLVISSNVGTMSVGILSNYSMIVTMLKQVISSVFFSMTAYIGNKMITKSSNQGAEEKSFQRYTYLRYVIASFIVIPWIILADNTVFLFFGNQQKISIISIVLLGIDLYIHIVYTPCCEYINGNGLFREDRIIAFCGAAINLVTSIYWVSCWNIEGVLLGTVISQIFLWIGRSYIVYFKIFCMNIKKYIIYIMWNYARLAIIFFQVNIIYNIKDKLYLDNPIILWICSLLICFSVNLFIQVVLFWGIEKRCSYFKDCNI